MQNGLLIMSKQMAHHSTIAKQVFFGRWKNKVQRQRKIMTKVIQIATKQEDACNQMKTKRAL